MRKKRVLFLAVTLAVLITGGLVYAESTGYTWEKFYHASGESDYYPVPQAKEPTAQEVRENSMKQGNDAPESAEIGDVFLGDEGYERVIAVSENGAFITEPATEENCD